MSLPRPLLLLALLTGLLAGLARAQSGTGAIEGRVFNAATGTALANARIGIEGTGIVGSRSPTIPVPTGSRPCRPAPSNSR